MKHLKYYREEAKKFLLRNIHNFTYSIDLVIDDSLRGVSNLPSRPATASPYVNLLGHRPLFELREKAVSLTLLRLNENQLLSSIDFRLDSLIRTLSHLPLRETKVPPYVRLFPKPSPFNYLKENIKQEMLSSKKASSNCISLIKSFEGCSLQAYPDPGTGGAPWTIGYGACFINNRPVHPKETISLEKAEQLLIEEVRDIERDIKGFITVPLSQNQYDSIISFVYNCGVYAFKESTLLKLLNQKEYHKAANEFLRWVKGGNGHPLPGLIRRRQAEKKLFLDSI